MRTRLSARYSSTFEGKSALRRAHDVWSRRTDKGREGERERERASERERGSETALFRVEHVFQVVGKAGVGLVH